MHRSILPDDGATLGGRRRGRFIPLRRSGFVPKLLRTSEPASKTSGSEITRLRCITESLAATTELTAPLWAIPARRPTAQHDLLLPCRRVELRARQTVDDLQRAVRTTIGTRWTGQRGCVRDQIHGSHSR